MRSLEINKTKKYYNEFAPHWVANKTNSFIHQTAFTKLTKLWPEKGAIVDIGCAHGIHVPLFLGIGRKLKYLGIDISNSFIKIARTRYPQLTFELGNIADAVTLPKKKFDGFMAAAVLMHIPLEHWPAMFENIETLSKKGAYGYITLPVFHPSGEPAPTDVRHFTLMNETEHRAYFTSRGWKVKQSGSLDGFSQEGVWRWYIVQLP